MVGFSEGFGGMSEAYWTILYDYWPRHGVDDNMEEILQKREGVTEILYKMTHQNALPVRWERTLERSLSTDSRPPRTISRNPEIAAMVSTAVPRMKDIERLWSKPPSCYMEPEIHLGSAMYGSAFANRDLSPASISHRGASRPAYINRGSRPFALAPRTAPLCLFVCRVHILGICQV